jgi:hypothetical protein
VAGDSVAHPWVNGFVGGLFGPPKSTGRHIALEVWVNARLLAEIGAFDPGRPAKDEFVGAAGVYLQNPEIGGLIVRAYDRVYSGRIDCKGARVFKTLYPVGPLESAGVRATGKMVTVCDWRCYVGFPPAPAQPAPARPTR